MCVRVLIGRGVCVSEVSVCVSEGAHRWGGCVCVREGCVSEGAPR